MNLTPSTLVAGSFALAEFSLSRGRQPGFHALWHRPNGFACPYFFRWASLTEPHFLRFGCGIPSVYLPLGLKAAVASDAAMAALTLVKVKPIRLGVAEGWFNVDVEGVVFPYGIKWF